MSNSYLYLKLLLRNNLLLDPDECALIDTKQQELVSSFLVLKLVSAFQPVQRADGKVIGREALLRANSLKHGALLPEVAFEDHSLVGKNNNIAKRLSIPIEYTMNSRRFMACAA